MRRTPTSDRVYAIISWGIVFGMLFAAAQVATISTAGTGPVAAAFGITTMKIFYSVVYTAQGLALAYSKAFKKKTMRKGVLMSIYLFMGFTTLLGVAGPAVVSMAFLDNAVLTVAAAMCWLHWKFRTEYLDPEEFNTYISMNDQPSTERD